MKQTLSLRTALAMVVSAIALGACFESGNDPRIAPPTAVVPPPVPPTPPTPPQPVGDAPDQAGAGFAAAFNRDAFDEPVDPMAGDIIALDKTAEPIPIPDP